MTAILETRDLCKSFGALAVTQHVSLTLEPGARHALIGPNGAGKTTFVNQLTGVLRPSSGTVYLDGEDITRLAPERRVRLGLSRTFQINSLFPHLSPIEAVAAAIFERDRDTTASITRWMRGVSHSHLQLEEAHALLVSLGLGDGCDLPTHELAYGRQRVLEIALALATRPRVLLLDEPAAGIPEGESDELFAVLDALPADVAILLIEHDMSLVFRFARRITVLVGGAELVTGSPEAIAADPRVREVYLGQKGALMATTPMLVVDGLRSGYGDAIVIDGCSFTMQEGEALALLGRNGVGKTTLLISLMGIARLRGGSLAWRGRDLARMRASDRARAGIGWVPQEREVFPSLTVEENLTVTALPGPWTLARVYGLFPRLAERRRNFGNQLSGGEQQMLAMGRALMLNPGLLLLDEPLEGLAPVIVDELCTAIEAMVESEGQALILVEQHVEQALALTHRAIVLERGRIVHQGSSDELRGDLQSLDRWIGVRVAVV